MEDRRTLEVVHVQSEVTVRYKYLSKERQDPGMDLVHESTSRDISKQGMIITLRVPNHAWTVELLQRKMYLGLNLLLPAAESPVKALGEIAWMEAFEDDGENTVAGVRFKEMRTDDRDEIFRFLIRAQGRRTV